MICDSLFVCGSMRGSKPLQTYICGTSHPHIPNGKIPLQQGSHISDILVRVQVIPRLLLVTIVFLPILPASVVQNEGCM